ncbi:MAG: YbhB/YbcL family Raf kinase inhibitor-like protein [Sulfurovum sp.]|nr:YbhB/YbcL family Raf kinase inhibitor-like protein [Sulfurovum sp.]MCB4745515.1 YbhB/YbcL family Raf kinase inhibitor-like protein [Sulfurovum sp.]MCB4752953.1 YbhB/YbcL family Raf kinase inhibitor-like protein [Sulfurovum sp.]MCB4755322.1 YbhB/YbcL family Raf kinase inhibitor-like protein [Sulfurovum sp.]MCB4760192.1 YbhB/YbcL family Raf kinase inhibitor-like protein [Sulfurovum sp.]
MTNTTKIITTLCALSVLSLAEVLPLPKVDTLKSVTKEDKVLIDVARTYAAFWDTGEEKYAKKALAKDFIDLNLPKGRKQGIQGPLDASKWFRSVVPDLKAEIKELIVGGDTVVSRLNFTGHFKGKFHNTQGKGQLIDFDAVDIYTIKNGKIKTNWHLEDIQTLLSQLNNPHVNKNFKLSSTTIKDGGKVDPQHYWNQFGCSGDNTRPELRWEGVPKDAKSLAITFYDKDAPTGSGFWHWIAYDIPVNTTKLDSASLPEGTKEGKTDMDKAGFFAPCPPPGRIHTYTFTLHAMDVDKLDVPKGVSGAVTRFYIENHTIDKATLSATAGPRK